MHIRVGDEVLVINGYYRDQRGRVKSISRDEGKLVVEGINLVYKHLRRDRRNARGGRLSREMPIQIANVQFLCPSCSAPTRTGARYLEDGSKERYCKRCKTGVGQIAPASPRYAALFKRAAATAATPAS